MKRLVFVSLLVINFLIMNTAVGYAQFSITYPSSAQSLQVCNNSSLLTVNVAVTASAGTSDNKVTITFPTGISYVDGTVAVTGGTPGLSIVKSGGTAQAPEFTISPATLTFGQNITFTVARTADCAAATYAGGGGQFKDKVSVTGTAGTSSDVDPTSNGYNVSFPKLTLVQPASVSNTTVGSTYSRTFQITNGSQIPTNAVHFTITYASGVSPVSLKLNGADVTPWKTAGSTYYYTLTGTQLGSDAQLTSGEVLTLTEGFKVLSCTNNTTQYAAGWGCSADPSKWCQTVNGTGSVTIAGGSPVFQFIGAVANDYKDMCTPFTVTYSFKNNGSGDVKAATMYDVALRLGGFSNALYWIWNRYIKINKATINGVAVNVDYIIDPTTTTIHNTQVKINLDGLFKSDPDGEGKGLADVDGDGSFDDLPSGQTVALTVEVQFILTENCDVNYNTSYGAVDMQYTTMCDRKTVITPPYAQTNTLGSVLTGVSSNTYAPANIYGGQPFNARFGVGFVSNGMGMFDNPNSRYVYELTLPSGLTIVPGSAKWYFGRYPQNIGLPSITPPTVE